MPRLLLIFWQFARPCCAVAAASRWSCSKAITWPSPKHSSALETAWTSPADAAEKLVAEHLRPGEKAALLGDGGEAIVGYEFRGSMLEDLPWMEAITAHFPEPVSESLAAFDDGLRDVH